MKHPVSANYETKKHHEEMSKKLWKISFCGYRFGLFFKQVGNVKKVVHVKNDSGE
jgi:hypothetical protein